MNQRIPIDPQNPKRVFKGVWIPVEIWDSNLSLQEKIIWTEIKYLDGPEGCYASNEYFRKFMGFEALSRIVDLITKLKKRGLVYCREGEDGLNGNPRILRICNNYPPAGIPATPTSNELPPPTSNEVGYTREKETREIGTSVPISVSHETPSSTNSPIQRKRPATQIPPPPEPRPPSIPPGTPAHAFVSLWNESSGDHHSHNLEGNSKLLDSVRMEYKYLITGSFFKNKSFDSKWLEDNPAVRKWKAEGHHFSRTELEEGMRRARLLYVKGYWPPDKSSLPKSLGDFLFNPRSGKSLFLKYMSTPPDLLAENVGDLELLEPSFLEEIFDVIGLDKKARCARRSIVWADDFLRDIKAAWEETLSAFPPDRSMSGGDFAHKFNNWQAMFHGYLEWLSEQHWISRLDLNCFKIPGGVVSKWFFELKKEFDYSYENFSVKTS